MTRRRALRARRESDSLTHGRVRRPGRNGSPWLVSIMSVVVVTAALLVITFTSASRTNAAIPLAVQVGDQAAAAITRDRTAASTVTKTTKVKTATTTTTRPVTRSTVVRQRASVTVNDDAGGDGTSGTTLSSSTGTRSSSGDN